MNYELAKKLKDAGFPYKEGETYYPIFPLKPLRESFTEEEMCKIVSLSELIEACLHKDRMNYLQGSFKLFDESYVTDIEIIENWRAKIRINPMDYSADGSTPEEAVARLYLELNKK